MPWPQPTGNNLPHCQVCRVLEGMSLGVSLGADPLHQRMQLVDRTCKSAEGRVTQEATKPRMQEAWKREAQNTLGFGLCLLEPTTIRSTHLPGIAQNTCKQQDNTAQQQDLCIQLCFLGHNEGRKEGPWPTLLPAGVQGSSRSKHAGNSSLTCSPLPCRPQHITQARVSSPGKGSALAPPVG